MSTKQLISQVSSAANIPSLHSDLKNTSSNFDIGSGRQKIPEFKNHQVAANNQCYRRSLSQVAIAD